MSKYYYICEDLKKTLPPRCWKNNNFISTLPHSVGTILRIPYALSCMFLVYNLKGISVPSLFHQRYLVWTVSDTKKDKIKIQSKNSIIISNSNECLPWLTIQCPFSQTTPWLFERTIFKILFITFLCHIQKGKQHNPTYET